MARREDRQRAIELRRQGKTYSEIKEELNVPKATLSGWLSDFQLSKDELARLEASIKRRKYLGIEKTRITKKKKRQRRLKRIYEEQKERLLPINKRELYLCGLFLYWGEGMKGLRSGVSLNNTDPKVVKFYYLWLTETLGVPETKIKVVVHLYKDMDIEKTLDYWSRFLNIPVNQFIKPYIKESSRKDIDHKGFGHGTCGLYICDQYLKEKVMLGIEVIAENITGIKTKDLV